MTIRRLVDFPNEILIEIFKHVASPLDLSACPQSCRKFYPVVQTVLYESIVLPTPESIILLIRTLLVKHHIATHVKKIMLDEGNARVAVETIFSEKEVASYRKLVGALSVGIRGTWLNTLNWWSCIRSGDWAANASILFSILPEVNSIDLFMERYRIDDGVAGQLHGMTQLVES
jgi:hypothetical protein